MIMMMIVSFDDLKTMGSSFIGQLHAPVFPHTL